MTDFSPPASQDNNKTIELYPVEGSEASHYSTGSQTLGADWRAGMDNSPGNVTAYWNLEVMALNFDAYGTTYRFVFRDDGIW